MSIKDNAVVVSASAADKGRYTKARNAFNKAGSNFRQIIGEVAKATFDKPVTVAEFAKAVGEDLSMAKGVTVEQKAERNTIRARIHDGLKHAEMLKVNEKAAKAQRKPRQVAKPASAADKAEEAKEAVEAAEEAQAPTQAEIFAGIASLLAHASPATLRRVANAVSTRLAA